MAWMASLQPNPCNDEVSVMSPNTRRGCLRAEQARPASTSDAAIRERLIGDLKKQAWARLKLMAWP